MIVTSFAVALVAGQAGAAPTVQSAPVVMTEGQALERAGRLGSLIHAHDRAAWVATDAMAAATPRDRLTGPGGWVVEPAPDGALTVTFFRGAGEAARVAYVARVRDGAVLDGRATKGAPLTSEQRRLVAARDAAIAEAAARGWGPCTSAPFNPVAFAGADGSAVVYLLSAQVATGAWPMGGHYRMLVGADGRVAAARRYTNSCVTLGSPPDLPAGARPAALAITHLLGSLPTELHVFTSLSARLPVIVGTRNGRVWQVAGTRITPVRTRR